MSLVHFFVSGEGGIKLEECGCFFSVIRVVDRSRDPLRPEIVCMLKPGFIIKCWIQICRRIT